MACDSRQPARSSAAIFGQRDRAMSDAEGSVGLALRQVTGLVASLLKLAKLDWPVPDYTTLCRRQKTLAVTFGGRPSSGGLHLLADSTGIKMTGEGEWKTRKHGASCRRQWRKVHLGIDAETMEIRVIEITTNEVGDAPVLPDLLAQIPPNERIAIVGADGAYVRHEEVSCRDRRASCRGCHSSPPKWTAMEGRWSGR